MFLINLKVFMEVTLNPKGIIETIKYMKDLIQVKVPVSDLGKIRLLELRQYHLQQAETKAIAWREFLFCCETISDLFNDEIVALLASIEDFLAWVKSEQHQSIRTF